MNERPLVAIGLDAGDPDLIEAWIAEGKLPTFAALKASGAWAPLRTFEHYRAETPWTTFLTGCAPKTIGYWSPLRYDASSYGIKKVRAYDFSERKPFYALGKGTRVAVFDMPQSKVCDEVDGVQVLAWGAHSPQTDSLSSPEGLLEELRAAHGPHPTLNDDLASVYDNASIRELRDGLVTGIIRRGEICVDLLRREPWDLFLTVFGETHSAGHQFLHLSRSNHPLAATLGKAWDQDPLLAVFQEIDRAAGRIFAAAPESATRIVFAAHGMGPNVTDLASMVFLPELLFRYSFPGRAAIAPGEAGAPVPPPLSPADLKGDTWATAVWRLTRESNALRQFLKQHLQRHHFRRLERWIGAAAPEDLDTFFDLRERGHIEPMQPPAWYQKHWADMKAFALPSFSEGYVRINLRGRDPKGQVDVGEYDRVCDEIATRIADLRDPRTGERLAKEIVRTRHEPLDDDPNLPDADLLVSWQEERAVDVVDSPQHGRIGPLPFLRSGGHRSNGFLLAGGPGVEGPRELPHMHAHDLAPTILAAMGQPIPEALEGKPVLGS